jgi:hypothetical protein
MTELVSGVQERRETMDNMVDPRELSLRLRRIERQSRIAQVGLAAMACVLAVVLLTGQKAPRAGGELPAVLDAQRLVIRDAQGRPRIELGAGEHGPALDMLDADGAKRITLQLWDDFGQGLIFRNAQGVELAYYARSNIRFIDDNQKLRCYLWAAENLIHGKVVDPPEAYGIMFYDENGKLRLKAGYPKEDAVLSLFDENGKQIWSALRPARP